MGWWGPDGSRSTRAWIHAVAALSAGCIVASASGCTSRAPDDRSDAAQRRTPSRAVASTTVPVAAPALRNRASDLVAVYRSLDAYVDWIAAHDPDPDVLARALVPGTSTFTAWQKEIEQLAAAHHRRVKVGTAIEDVRLVSRDADLATLLVRYRDERVDVIDKNGTVVAETPQRLRSTWIVVLRQASDGRWRIASVARQGGVG